MLNGTNGPKITVIEICNKTFAYSYSGKRSVESSLILT